MATITTVKTVCDITGKEADEKFAFAFDGTRYEIDLAKKLAEEFRAAMAPFLKVATPLGNVQTGKTGNKNPEVEELRLWAESHGVRLKGRGKIPHDTWEAFHAWKATQTAPKVPTPPRSDVRKRDDKPSKKQRAA